MTVGCLNCNVSVPCCIGLWQLRENGYRGECSGSVRSHPSGRVSVLWLCCGLNTGASGLNVRFLCVLSLICVISLLAIVVG